MTYTNERRKTLFSRIIKQLIVLNIAILLLIVGYKVYLGFHEPDFQASNIENIKQVEERGLGDTYSYVVFGSIESSINVFQNKIIHKINEDPSINFAVSTGDAVLDGAEDKYQILHRSLNKLEIPKLVGAGDGEIADGGDIRFYQHFGPYYFSFYSGNSYFIFVDTTGMTTVAFQKDWILQELNKADKFTNVFVFMNDAPIKTASNNLIQASHYIASRSFREFLIRELANHKVDGVFTNGSILYEKKLAQGVPYYISGGSGGLLNQGSKGIAFHYLKVNVSPKGVDVQSISQPVVSSQVLVQKIERLWIYIHSIFYVNFTNILLGTFAALLIFLIVYNRASRGVDYYRDFKASETEIPVKEKLTIAMFTDNYFPFIGGVPISIRRLAQALRTQGHQVVLFTPKYRETYEDDEEIVRCDLMYYHKKGQFHFACANIFSPKIEAEFSKHNFDIIHVHHPFLLGRKGLWLGEKYNIPVIFTYHTRIDQYAENIPFLKLVFKNILSHRMIRKFAQRCNSVIAPTKSAKEYLENIGVSRRKAVLPTGVDFSEFNCVSQNTIDKIRDLYAPNGEILICSASRLAVEKNIGFLINGLKLVKEKTSVPFRCVMLGDGPDRENIQGLIDRLQLNDQIEIAGTIRPKEMAAYFLAADFFVFSSLSETQGMVLLEAMAGGCPVVSVRSSGTDDVVQEGYNGFKTPEDPQLWADKVVELIENGQTRHELSVNAISFAQKFSEEKIATLVEAFYRKTIKERKTPCGENHE